MPVESTTVSVRGGEFETPVYRKGAGEPLLWLHGAGGMGPGFTPDLDALAEHYDVIAPVTPGFDDTPGLEKIDDIHDLVIYYQDFCDALGLTSFRLAGHSLGGMFAAEFAAARPDMVKKLMLVDPVGLWMDETPVTDIFTLLPSELPGVLYADPKGPAAAAMMKPPANDEELEQAMYMRLVNFSATGKFIWPIPDKGLKKRIHRVTAPTLLVWGKEDRLVPPVYADEFARRLPDARVQTVDGAGHAPHQEQPETVARMVRDFLTPSAA